MNHRLVYQVGNNKKVIRYRVMHYYLSIYYIRHSLLH